METRNSQIDLHRKPTREQELFRLDLLGAQQLKLSSEEEQSRILCTQSSEALKVVQMKWSIIAGAG